MSFPIFISFLFYVMHLQSLIVGQKSYTSKIKKCTVLWPFIVIIHMFWFNLIQDRYKVKPSPCVRPWNVLKTVNLTSFIIIHFGFLERCCINRVWLTDWSATHFTPWPASSAEVRNKCGFELLAPAHFSFACFTTISVVWATKCNSIFYGCHISSSETTKHI